jgi:hypothetical protein
MTTVTEDSRIRLACHVGKLLATCFAVPDWERGQVHFLVVEKMNLTPFALCSDWTDGSNASSGDFGMNLNADGYWTYFLDGIAFGCTVPMRLYCFGDNDSLFLDSFDEQ